MTGYRRVEPAFCRGCGTPWVPGADACPSCGEAIEREAAPTGDPRAVPRLRATLIVSGVLLAARWGALIAMPLVVIVTGDLAWLAASVAATVLAVLTAPLWYPGSLPASLRSGARWPVWAAAGIVGVGLPLGIAASLGVDQFTLPVFFGESLTAGANLPTLWVAGLVAMIVFEELMFRGLLFDGVASLGSKRNAAIASAIVFAMLSLDAAYAALGVAAAALRLWSGSVWPGIAMRLIAGALWIAAFREALGS